MQELTLTEWLERTSSKREAIILYSKSPLPTDRGERHLDLSKALEIGQEAEELRADAEARH